MSAWNQALDAAGIRDPGLRDDYTRQRELTARFKRSAYLAARLLLPRPLFPHVMAMTAFMHHSDNLLDSGAKEGRAAAYDAWERQVRAALATGGSGHPVLRPVLHTLGAHPRLRGHIEEYLVTARADLDFAGFATEADHQAYIDAYSLPAFLLVACLLAPDGDGTEFRAACRTFIDAGQRLDFVNDLAEDLADGRLTIPRETLARHGVTREDLEQARDLPGTRELISAVLGQARATLADSRPLVTIVPAPGRPLVRALISFDELTAAAAARKGAGLLTAPARPSAPGAVRVLLREYARARRLRRAGAGGTRPGLRPRP
ncbi:phytoene/squalene synthase family protein [Streptomyces xanthochromogenes]|uniref:phytoene/squalene synthase family protein n=1 Tax=Streptomyces xanthochromogenes TaxID=67384 RepID=UPI003790997A